MDTFTRTREAFFNVLIGQSRALWMFRFNMKPSNLQDPTLRSLNMDQLRPGNRGGAQLVSRGLLTALLSHREAAGRDTTTK